MGKIAAVGLVLTLTAWPALAQQKPGQTVQGQSADMRSPAQQQPDNIALAYTMLGNSIRDLLGKQEAELGQLRSVLQQTAGGLAASEAWWKSCVKDPACVSWVNSGTQAPVGQPDTSGNVPPK